MKQTNGNPGQRKPAVCMRTLERATGQSDEAGRHHFRVVTGQADVARIGYALATDAVSSKTLPAIISTICIGVDRTHADVPIAVYAIKVVNRFIVQRDLIKSHHDRRGVITS